MKKLVLFAIAATISLAAISQQKSEIANARDTAAQTAKPNVSNALGTWQIDLRPTPDSKPYPKEIKFTTIEGKQFNGEFYGYPFTGGTFNTDWGRVYFAFSTADQTYTYFHSGYILGNEIFGISYCEGRKLTLPWTGTKK